MCNAANHLINAPFQVSPIDRKGGGGHARTTRHQLRRICSSAAELISRTRSVCLPMGGRQRSMSMELPICHESNGGAGEALDNLCETPFLN